jgi:putative ABC transport system permease protein
MILQQGEGIVVAGAFAGLVVFMLFAKLLESVAFEVRTVDVTTLTGALATVVAISLVATWMPARRAARIDPAEALRSD